MKTKIKPKVHKFMFDNKNSAMTACGLFRRPGLVVNADMRKTTCGNCARVKSTRTIAVAK